MENEIKNEVSNNLISHNIIDNKALRSLFVNTNGLNESIMVKYKKNIYMKHTHTPNIDDLYSFVDKEVT